MRLLTFSTRSDATPRAGLRDGKRIVDLGDQAKWSKLMREAGIKPE